MAKPIATSILGLLLFSQTSLQAANCYYPDGTFAEFDSPCFPDQDESFCCGQGHTCMSNNLCRWPDSEMVAPLAYIRGSCTDSSWNSTECGNVCKTVFPSSYDPIIGCPGADFCCELDGSNPSGCCNLTNTTAHPLYKIAAASTVTVIDTSSTSAPLLPSTVTGGGGSNTSPTVTPTNTKAADSGGSSSGSKIGIGVGVGVGALAVVVGIAVFFYLRKRRSGNGATRVDEPYSGTGPAEVSGREVGTRKAELHGQTAPAPAHVDQKVPVEGADAKTGEKVGYSELGANNDHMRAEMP